MSALCKLEQPKAKGRVGRALTRVPASDPAGKDVVAGRNPLRDERVGNAPEFLDRRIILHLQRAAGNRAVNEILASMNSGRRSARFGTSGTSDLAPHHAREHLASGQNLGGSPSTVSTLNRQPVVQRCGATPCDCPREEKPLEPPPTALGLMVQRKPADMHGLMSARFAKDPALEEVHRGGRILRPQAKGPHVAKVQRALIDFEIPLPKFGADSTYGSETLEAVKKFQRRQGLAGKLVDGEVGPVTMDLLDKKALSVDPAPSPPPSPQGSDRKVPNKIAVEQTKPQTSKNGQVQEPGKAEVKQQSQTTVVVANEPEPAFQIPVNIGITIPWKTIPPRPADDKSLTFCENGVVQIGGKWNVDGILIPGTGGKLSLLAEPELDINFAPAFCGKSPAIQGQVELFKLKLGEAVDLSLVGLLGSDSKPFGIARGGGVVVDVKLPIPRTSTKLELGGQGQWTYVPSESSTKAEGIFGASIIVELPASGPKKEK
jgi:peptidoglycan hydrolase-like protein with peptidoglycan-binding domain